MLSDKFPEHQINQSENDEHNNFVALEVRKIVEKLNPIGVHSEVLVDLSPTDSPNTLGLGPAFKNNPPESLSNFYPLAEKALPFSKTFKAKDTKGSFFCMRGWHQPSKKWIDWVDRVEAEKGELWKELNIYDAIMFGKHKIHIDKPLLLSSLFFWSVSTNAFHFQCGMMSPTIQDVCFLIGLRPHGEEVTPLLFNRDISFQYPTRDTNRCYSQFLDVFKGSDTAPVTQTEHIAFLIYWLNKCLFRVPAINITQEFNQVAIALASGRKLALAPLLLSYLYRTINDFVAGSFATCAGPLWLLQFWLQAYFPELGPQINPDVDVPLHGYHYLTAKPKEQNFAACFRYFYEKGLYRSPNQFNPFLPRVKGPKWLLYNPGEAPPQDAEEHHDVWSSFLIRRDLFYSSALSKCGVEYYNAAQLARQFGLTQLVPLPPYHSGSKVFPSRSTLSSQVQERDISALFQNFKTRFQLKKIGEMPMPNTTSAFDLWWAEYIIATRRKDAGMVLRRISAFFGSSLGISEETDDFTPIIDWVKRRRSSTEKAPMPPRQLTRSGSEQEKEEEEEALALTTNKKVRKSKTSPAFRCGKLPLEDGVLQIEAQPNGSSQELGLVADANHAADIHTTLTFPPTSSTTPPEIFFSTPMEAYFSGIEWLVGANESVTTTPLQTGPSKEDIEKAKCLVLSTAAKGICELPEIAVELIDALSVLLTGNFACGPDELCAMFTLREQIPALLVEYDHFTKTLHHGDSQVQRKKNLEDRIKDNVAIFKQSNETGAKLTQREEEIEKEMAKLQHELNEIRKEKEKKGHEHKSLMEETVEINEERLKIIGEEPRLEADKKEAVQGFARAREIWTQLTSKLLVLYE